MTPPPAEPTIAALNGIFERMQAAARATPLPAWPVRRERLLRLRELMHRHREALCAAVAADYGQRPAQDTQLYELFPCEQALAYTLRHGKSWMRPRRHGADWWAQPGHCRTVPQPLGVVGVVAPWNYPYLLSFGPLIDALAAGNRVLIKPSEHTPRAAGLLAELVTRTYNADEVAVVCGEASVAAAFCALPFDHLLFTGSTQLGRRVMQAASANLTPLTLELGGKSPAIIGTQVRMEAAVASLLRGKLINAGQTCIAPDYVLVPRSLQPRLVASLQAQAQRLYPALDRNPDYARLINTAQFERLQGWLDEAVALGARALPLGDARPDPVRRLMPPMLLLDTPPQARVMQEEIFGPLLPIIPYDTLDEALAYVNTRPRPLALYVFDQHQPSIDRVLRETVSGGVTVNDTLLHLSQHALRFGGVGPSGMGAYHGRTGFETFSHMKPVFVQSRFNTLGFLLPPYGRFQRFALKWLLR